jgi:hypothetical protein
LSNAVRDYPHKSETTDVSDPCTRLRDPDLAPFACRIYYKWEFVTYVEVAKGEDWRQHLGGWSSEEVKTLAPDIYWDELEIEFD